MGRWLSRDPLSEVADVHLFRHSMNAPQHLVDPHGLVTLDRDETILLGPNGSAVGQSVYRIPWSIKAWCDCGVPKNADLTFGDGDLVGHLDSIGIGGAIIIGAMVERGVSYRHSELGKSLDCPSRIGNIYELDIHFDVYNYSKVTLVFGLGLKFLVGIKIPLGKTEIQYSNESVGKKSLRVRIECCDNKESVSVTEFKVEG